MFNKLRQEITDEQLDRDISEADMIEKELRGFTRDTRSVSLPKPPKPGEIMICQYCGKPMYPKDFSKNEKIRKREFKWHLHEKCMIAMSNIADIKTPGLIADRKRQGLWKKEVTK